MPGLCGTLEIWWLNNQHELSERKYVCIFCGNTYDTATGSDEMISRTFSQPSVVMYAMQYISCQDGVGGICTKTVYVENIRNSI